MVCPGPAGFLAMTASAGPFIRSLNLVGMANLAGEDLTKAVNSMMVGDATHLTVVQLEGTQQEQSYEYWS